MRYRLPFTRAKQTKNLQQEIEILKEQIEESNKFINEIEKGNLTVGWPVKFSQNSLGVSLQSMQNHLLKISEEEKQRNWVNTGIAKFAEILRNNKGLGLADLAQEILSNLVKYVEVNQGAIYIVEGEKKEEIVLNMIACYAYNKKKYVEQKIHAGEGLVGQCYLENMPIMLKEVPQGYVTISSGLGEARPHVIFICPLKSNEKTHGILEIASFNDLQSHHLKFLETLAENIGATFKNGKDNERTRVLLNMSQQQEEELRTQEEEMRQNLEEMQATTEEMQRKSLEVQEAASSAQGMMVGINATMATIEFTVSGQIVQANNNFLKVTGYSLEEIKGKHHKIFVPLDMQKTEDYQKFWARLESGQSHSGIFQRINAKGEVLWFNAIYNPIIGLSGKVERIIKFATDVSLQQEMVAANKDIMQGINATMATIEFSMDGLILSANENFLKVMNYSLKEIKGKHHKMFVPASIAYSDEHTKFWEDLSAGKIISGEFERRNAAGEPVWLNASYTPVSNASGQVYKVIKFATDITQYKLQNAQPIFQKSA